MPLSLSYYPKCKGKFWGLKNSIFQNEMIQFHRISRTGEAVQGLSSISIQDLGTYMLGLWRHHIFQKENMQSFIINSAYFLWEHLDDIVLRLWVLLLEYFRVTLQECLSKNHMVSCKRFQTREKSSHIKMRRSKSHFICT